MTRFSIAMMALVLLGSAAEAQVPTYQGPGGVHAKCNEVEVLHMPNTTYPPDTVFFGVKLSDWTPDTVAFLKGLVDRCTRGRNLRSDYVPELYAAIDAYAQMPAQQRALADKHAAEQAKAEKLAKCEETSDSILYHHQENVIAGIENLANFRKRQAHERRIAETSGVRDLTAERAIGELIVESEDELKADFAEYKRLGGKAPSPDKVTHQLANPCAGL